MLAATHGRTAAPRLAPCTRRMCRGRIPGALRSAKRPRRIFASASPRLDTRARHGHNGNEGVSLESRVMAQPMARKVSPKVVGALDCGAAAGGRSAEAGHRDFPRASFSGAREDFAVRAEALRRWLRSSVDSAETIRADRDRDCPARGAAWSMSASF